jgi:DNA-binding MarR family transcriptional regulator
LCVYTHLLADCDDSVRKMARKGNGEAVTVIFDFVEFVARSAVGQRQRRRIEMASGSPVAGAELAALRAVRRYQPASVSDLASHLRLDRTTVSRVIAALDASGLVIRESDTNDGRKSWVGLSSKGATLLRRVDAVSLQDFAVATSRWTRADRDALAQLMRRLQNDLERLQFDDSGLATGHGPHRERPVHDS